MRRDILSKLSFVFLLVVSSFVAHWKTNLAIFGILSVIGLLEVFLRSEHPSRITTYRRFFTYITTLLFLATILNGIFLREGEISFALIGINFYSGGLVFGVTTGVRLAVISLSLLLFFLTTHIRELIGFFQRIGLPGQIVVVLFLALHFLAQIPARINQIYTAQEARGANVRGNILARAGALTSVLFPLLLSSISETVERGSALELRGFRGTLAEESNLPFPMTSKFIAAACFLTGCGLLVFSLLR